MMTTGKRGKAFVAAVRGGKDNGDGTSAGNPTTQPGQLLKALVMKNAEALRNPTDTAHHPRLNLASMRPRKAPRHAATARQIMKMSKR
jgi:hypothetical protein